MLARDEREDLLAATVDLYSRGGVEPDDCPCAERSGSFSERVFGGGLSAEDEAQVREVTTALESIVRAIRPRSPLPPPPATAVVAAIGGAEMLMHAEILAGRSDWLPRLLPSFTFVTSVPFLDRDESLRLSDRTRELVEQALKRAEQ